MMSGYTISRFSEDSEGIVRENESDAGAILRLLKPKLETLLKSGIPGEAFIPRKDRYAMNLVYIPKDRIFSVTSGVWNAGQTTQIHDHLTWALVGVYSGMERETIYKRSDDGLNPNTAKLEMVSDRANESGHVTTLSERGIHKVCNTFNEPAYSIHVYGRDIGNTERHSYDPVNGSISTFKSGYCNVLRDLDEL
ncbi:MAG: cysteine dioxygenase [Nitrososphaerales archaeon]